MLVEILVLFEKKKDNCPLAYFACKLLIFIFATLVSYLLKIQKNFMNRKEILTLFILFNCFMPWERFRYIVKICDIRGGISCLRDLEKKYHDFYGGGKL